MHLPHHVAVCLVSGPPTPKTLVDFMYMKLLRAMGAFMAVPGGRPTGVTQRYLKEIKHILSKQPANIQLELSTYNILCAYVHRLM